MLGKSAGGRKFATAKFRVPGMRKSGANTCEETRNPKQIQMAEKGRNPKPAEPCGVLSLWPLDLGFVLDFGFRISGLGTARLPNATQLCSPLSGCISCPLP